MELKSFDGNIDQIRLIAILSQNFFFVVRIGKFNKGVWTSEQKEQIISEFNETFWNTSLPVN